MWNEIKVKQCLYANERGGACLTGAGTGLPLLIGTLSDVFWFLRDDGTRADLHRSEVQTLTLHTHSLTRAPVGPLHQITVT